jgi:hypothetical protein
MALKFCKCDCGAMAVLRGSWAAGHYKKLDSRLRSPRERANQTIEPAGMTYERAFEIAMAAHG